jgi:hypothetical protein
MPRWTLPSGTYLRLSDRTQLLRAPVGEGTSSWLGGEVQDRGAGSAMSEHSGREPTGGHREQHLRCYIAHVRFSRPVMRRRRLSSR